MIDRRRFLKSIAAAAATPALSSACARTGAAIRELRGDPESIIDLPAGFTYTIVSRRGVAMSDGLSVPGAHDGMAAFPGDDGRVILLCNHELAAHHVEHSAFGGAFESLSDAVKACFYDRGDGVNPALGGTTTTIYNPRTKKTEKQFMSLAGTEINCAGGPTPWHSWLSCEESFSEPGTSYSGGIPITREQHHGYVFEVPANADGLVDAKPIKAMGRFEHEAAAVDANTGIVYMTEDRFFSLFYRYIPTVPGHLMEGGRLQALAIDGQPSVTTHNWSAQPDVVLNKPMATRWIDLHNVDAVDNDLRLRGAAAGAAMFARGEGLCAGNDALAFTCTIGGAARLGQVFSYIPSPFEGKPQEEKEPGQLTLIAEADNDSLLRNADNLTRAPWGDLIVCEDTSDHCGLVGIRPDGSLYAIADNPYSNSELTGVCFSPDGQTLFVNIQYPGMTLAVTGPWPAT